MVASSPDIVLAVLLEFQSCYEIDSFWRPALEKSSARNENIDLFRCLAFICVVAIHVISVPKELSSSITAQGLILEACRFAVPYFFIVSGYLLSTGPVWPAIVKFTRRIGLMYAFWLALYVAFDIAIDHASPASYLQPMKFLKTLFTGGSAYHLWFLPSLWMGAVIFMLIRRFGWPVVAIASALLFVAGLAFGPYREILHLPSLPVGTRNGPFFSLLLVATGAYLRERNYTPAIWLPTVLIVLGMVIQFCESLFLLEHAGTVIGTTDVYLGTPILGLGVFLLALSLPNISSVVSKLGQWAGFAYCVHFLFIRAFDNIDRSSLPMSLAIVIAVAALSLLSATIVARKGSPLHFLA